MNRQKLYFQLTGTMGALAVMLGAFGAHALKSRLEVNMLEVYKTGVLYHFIHVLAMMLCAVALGMRENAWLKRSFYLFFFGILLFSGSLYCLSTAALTGIHFNWMGPITPLGGLLYILGWLSLSQSYRS